MGKFGIGARVRDWQGDLATIIGKDADHRGERQVRYDDPIYAQDMWLSKERMTPVEPEAVTPPKFKVGDRVRLTADNGGYGVSGDEGVIKVVDSDGTVRIEFQSGALWWASVNILEAASLTLRAGGYYKLRNGGVVGPLVDNAHGKYVFTTSPRSSITESWQADGRRYNYGEHDRDIVEEVSAPVVEPVEPTLKIQTSKFYRTRDGKKVGPITEHGVPTHVSGILEGEKSSRVFIREGGQHWLSQPHTSNLDLVAEWVGPEPVMPPKPEPKFKVGDKIVRISSPASWAPLGYVATYQDSGTYTDLFGHSGTYLLEDQWRLATPADTMPIGTKVTLTGVVTGHCGGAGNNVNVKLGGHAKSLGVPVSALTPA